MKLSILKSLSIPIATVIGGGYSKIRLNLQRDTQVFLKQLKNILRKLIYCFSYLYLLFVLNQYIPNYANINTIQNIGV